MFIKSDFNKFRFQSVIFEAVDPSSNFSAEEKVLLGAYGNNTEVSLNKVLANHPILTYVDLTGVDVSKVVDLSGTFGGSLNIKNPK